LKNIQNCQIADLKSKCKKLGITISSSYSYSKFQLLKKILESKISINELKKKTQNEILKIIGNPHEFLDKDNKYPIFQQIYRETFNAVDKIAALFHVIEYNYDIRSYSKRIFILMLQSLITNGWCASNNEKMEFKLVDGIEELSDGGTEQLKVFLGKIVEKYYSVKYTGFGFK